MKKEIFIILGIHVLFVSVALAQSSNPARGTTKFHLKNDTIVVAANHRVMFIELGSVKCIPCRAMQPVMKSVEKKYGGQVRVVFYDVWKQGQAHFAQDYGIRVIPTQVFLDKAGKELMRHEGFFPENQIDAFLQSKGLIANSNVED